MKLLHTSDLHFGISIANVSMIEDQRAMTEEVIRIAGEEKVDAVLIAGDIFDHALSSAQAIALYDELVTRLCADMGIAVLLCAGNHDGAARLSSCGRLLSGAGLHVVGSIAQRTEAVSICDCDIHILPWFNTDEVRYLYPEAEVGGYGEAFALLLDKIRESFVPGRKNILLAHCFVTGAQVVESDRSVAIGGASMVSAFAFEGFDYVALGHLHRAQTIGKNVRYSGSPLKYSFDETGREKSVTIFDTGTSEMSEREILPLHDMRIVKGSYAQVLMDAETDEKREDYIKAVLEDEYAHQQFREALEQYYPNLLILEGKAYSEGGAETTLTVGEVAQLSAVDIMRRFYTEATDGQPPDEDMEKWFAAALREAQEGEGKQ